MGEQGTPPSLDRYLYAYSNPTVYIDLQGYDAIDYWSGLVTSYVNIEYEGLKKIPFLPFQLLVKQDYSAEEVRNAGKDVGQVVDDAGWFDRVNNRYVKHYKVDFRKGSIESSYERKTVKERLKDFAQNDLTLGLYPGGKALGNTAGAIVARFDKDLPKEFRDQADYEAGEGTISSAMALASVFPMAKGGGTVVQSIKGRIAARTAQEVALTRESVAGEATTITEPITAQSKEFIQGSGGAGKVYEIPASELEAGKPYIGKTRRPVPKRMADPDHRIKTPTGTPPKAKTLAENLTPDETAGLEALLVKKRGLENLSNKIPPLNPNLPKNAARFEAARKVLEKYEAQGGGQ